MIPQHVIQSLILLAVAAVVTMLCVPFAKWLAKKTDAIDYPSARRVNAKPIPRLGGVAMFLGMVAALLVLAFGIFVLGWETPFGRHELLDDVSYFWLGVSVLIIFAVGLADDIKSLNPKVKFLGQLIAGSVAAAAGLLLTGMQFPGHVYVNFGWLSYPITVIYLVAFANIINLIDGLDGLASGISAISALAIMILSLIVGQTASAFLCAALIGACLGFLRFNYHPASIFMGDCGALTLGFTLGVVSLLAVAKSTIIIALLIPILGAGIPVIDTAAAIIRRIRGHRPIDEADKGHLHHRLLEAGYSQRTTVHIMWGWTALLAVFGLLMVFLQGVLRWIMVVAAIALSAFVIARFHILRPTAVHGYDAVLAKEAEAEVAEEAASAEEVKVPADGTEAPAGEGQAEDSIAGAKTPVTEERA
ncbi:MAG: undecaprenyl/decaprenyl-phosphate alpha-N-acetylglucosaminyl 1-phosphate transferase [Eggerthellaceae bacterium]|nr:undecaprenyl/decaprenyl-phosphate alpha-N-acetylglucosaminyl 1-phosphate transferase [Eggerthellaceae bacterium]